MDRFAGRRAVVSGGASGIGAAVAQRIRASEECSFSTGAVFDASGGRATY